MGYIVDQYAEGKANIAFMGERKSIWHRLGNQMEAGMSIEQWAKAAGLDWEAVMVPAWMPRISDDKMVFIDGVKHCVRSDNNFHLGVATDVYKPFQPIEALQVLEPYCQHDSRFQMDVAGHLCGGKKIWATAVFNDDLIVGGDKHKARLLATTTYDGTGATIIKATATRTICDNTLDIALSAKGGEIRTRHSTKVDHKAVGEQLSVIVQGMGNFKRMGDAMASYHLKQMEVQSFFKKLLGIDQDGEDVSTRKLNQLNEMNDAYVQTIKEGTEPETAWCALNAVTRYVDHVRGTRDTGHGELESRFVSAQFTSGAALKAKAVNELYAMSDGELLKAVSAKTDDKWIAETLAASPWQ